MDKLNYSTIRRAAFRIATNYLNSEYLLKKTFNITEQITLQGLTLIVKPMILDYFLNSTTNEVTLESNDIVKLQFYPYNIFIDVGIFYAYKRYFGGVNPSITDILSFIGENYIGDMAGSTITMI